MTSGWRFNTINCVRIWHFYAHVGPAEIVRAVALACVGGSLLAVPATFPGAAIPPPVPHGGVAFGGPALYGPAYELGAGFAPGLYAFPFARTYSQSTTPELGQTVSDFNWLGLIPGSKELGASTTPMLSGDVSHWLPDRDVPGQSVPPTEVPEPTSWLLMVAALLFAIRQRVCK